MRNNVLALDPKKVQHAMVERELNQARLARKIGVHESRVSVWVRGKGNPDLVYAFDLADALGVTVDSLRKV